MACVAREPTSIAITDREYIDRDFNDLDFNLRKTHRTAEVSCGEFRTSQHFHVAGHSLPNSSNMIRLSGWESPYFGEFSVPMPNGCRIGKTATVWGTKAKPSVAPKPRRLCCQLPNHALMTLAQTFWPRCAESDQGFRGVRFGSKADIRAVRRHVRYSPESGHRQAPS